MSSKSVNWKKQTRLSAIGLAGLLLMFAHQNCGPADLSAHAISDPSTIERGMPVTTIDNIHASAGVSFEHKAVEIQSHANNLHLEGICSLEQEDAVLGWKVRELNADGSMGSEFARGFANCKGGSFQVELTPTQELQCNKPYKLVARLASGSPGEVVVTRPCAQ